MRTRSVVCLGALCTAALVLLGACTNNADPIVVDETCPAGGTWSADGSNQVAADQVCQRIAELQCAAEACCCADTARKSASHSACIKAMYDGCKNTAKTEEITTDPRTGFDTSAAGTALDGFEQYARACDPKIVEWSISPDGVGALVRGTVSPGKQCWTLVEGADAAAFASCKTGYACLPDPGKATSPWTCKPRAKLGEICLADVSCADGLRCEPNLSTNLAKLGRCMQRLPNGSACMRGLQCTSLFCQSGKCAAPSVSAAYCLAPTK